jgi:hypothetical protein
MNDVNLSQIVSHLSEKIGIRFGGTENELSTAYYIRDTLKSLSLDSNIEFYNFLGWEINGEPNLQIKKPIKKNIECNSFVYSMKTPAGGVEGFIRKAGKMKIVDLFEWDKYIIEDVNKIPKAYIVSSSDDFPHSIPILDPTILMPQVVVSKNSSELFDKFLDVGENVLCSLLIDCKFKDDAISQNVVTEIEGRNNEKMMIVGGHYDTAYNSPGAWDNGTGTAGMFKIIEYFKNNKPPFTLRFVFFGCEEYLFLGSKAYIKNLIDKNELDKVFFMINFDATPPAKKFANNVGKQLIQVYEKEYKVKEMLTNSMKKVNLDKTFKIDFTSPPLPNSDQWPFYKEEIPCIKFSEPGGSYDFYHTPNDTIDKLDFDIVNQATNFIIDFIKNFEI